MAYFKLDFMRVGNVTAWPVVRWLSARLGRTRRARGRPPNHAM